MLWEELSSKGIANAVKDCEKVCILPIGVLEKHGDHLPLGTDMYIARAVAEAAAELCPAVVFPYYYLGQIAEAVHVAGTIAPSHRLIMDALLEMCDEIHRNGFQKILLLNGHGGNLYFLPFFAQMLPGIKRPYAVYSYFVHSLSDKQYETVGKQTGNADLGGHAGLAETSLIMHIRPDLVHMEKVNVKESESLGRLDNLTEMGCFTAWDWYSKFPHHFAGDPSQSSAGFGKFLFEIMRDNAVRLLKAMKADTMTPGLIAEFNGLCE
jgi:creatinine amidohydrolase